MKTALPRYRLGSDGGFMTMGAHLHGAVWMGVFLAAFSLLGKYLGWNIWLSFALGFIPCLLLGNMMGEFTFCLQCWISERRSRAVRGAVDQVPKD